MKIYHIIINDQVAYVGKTINPAQRTRQHKWLLVNGIHQNHYLQEQYNKHKLFELVVIIDNATKRDEQVEIAKYNTVQRNNRSKPTLEELRALHNRVFSKKG